MTRQILSTGELRSLLRRRDVTLATIALASGVPQERLRACLAGHALSGRQARAVRGTLRA
ncbi:hypothetical protein [Serinibacter salmoneus]|uniref:Transcriptional regulator n=1 Tax=Serinibacter salmoneus TaxID=556530 RepID=A0A2A9D4E1_9MICO|nr:hypothetical protein [Serinibacter salmoneus]PFG20719.1 hypothetical protein ATL40_2329 [Serinibacter salmoneus]